jgi:predicted DNA-binding transcriptional regulator AlpA
MQNTILNTPPGAGPGEGAAAPPEKWITRRETAAIVGVKTRTLDKWRKRGIGPEYRRLLSTRSIRYSENSVRAWQDQCRKATEVPHE